MKTARANPIVRVLPSLTDVAFVLPLVFLFGGMNGAQTLLGDGDTGWHIRTGEWILAHHQVPRSDLFSFTRAGQPWYAWEWLWDVLFGWMHQRAGMAAVILASLLVICFTFAALFRLVRRTSGHDLIAISITLLAMAGASIHWLARPHLFTLLFVVIFYALLERVRDAFDGGRRKHAGLMLAALPLLTVLWTNLHGGFFVGIVLISAFGAGEIAAALLEPGARTGALIRARAYFLSALGCLLASFLNPYGYELHRHIYGYLTDSYLRRHITEFRPLNLENVGALYFEAMLLLGAAAALWHLSRRRFPETLLVAAWAHLGMISGRNVPIFMIVAAPAVALALREWCDALSGARVADWVRTAAARAREFSQEIGAMDRIPRLHLASAFSLALVAALVFAPAPPKGFRPEYDPKVYPAGALAALPAGGLGGRLFTHDEWGDYLIYRLYPREKVYVDGRSDFYGARFIEKYLEVLNVRYDWETTLGRFAIDAVLMPPDMPLAATLKESARWRVVYDDGVAILFRAAQPGGGGVAQSSRAQDSAGQGRDRRITKVHPGDPRVAKLKPKA